MPGQQGQAFDDLRNTISECVRIMRHRWRLAVVGLSVVASIGFWYSQYLPREYSASTLFERRDDAVLQNLISSNSPYGFGHLRTTLTLDMMGSRALARAALRMGLLPADTVIGEGALGDAERNALDAALGKYDVKPSVNLVQSTGALDTIQVQCTSNDPDIARDFAVALRDNYIGETRERIRGILNDTKAFFESEVARLRQEVTELDRELRSGFDDYPGLDPTDLTGVGSRLENLRLQRDGLFQHKAELEAQIAAREQFLVAAPALGFIRPMPSEGAPSTETAIAPPPVDAGLEKAIEGLKTQLWELLTVRRMTMEHPEAKRLRGRLDALEELRSSLSADAPTTDQTASAQTPLVADQSYREWQTQQMRVELELDSLRRQLVVATQQLEERETRVARFTELYEKLVTGGEAQRRLRDKRGSGGTELSLWQGHLSQLDRVLTAESGERGTQFALLEEPKDVSVPTRPRISAIFVVCSGLGLAAAALAVALAELFDRSFRSVGQVTRTLGVPVLECVSVIPTPRERRRVLCSRLVWAPTLALLLMILAVTATLAYTSIARPGLHRSAMQRMDRILGSVGVASLLPPSGRST